MKPKHVKSHVWCIDSTDQWDSAYRTASVMEVRALNKWAITRGKNGPNKGPCNCGSTALERRSFKAALTPLSASPMHSASFPSTVPVCRRHGGSCQCGKAPLCSMIADDFRERYAECTPISPASEPPLGAAGKAVAGLAGHLCALSRCNGLSDLTIPAPHTASCLMALVLAAYSGTQGWTE